MNELETKLSLSFSNFLIGSFIVLFSKYVNLFSDPLNQIIEVVIGVCVIGGVLLTLYGLGGIRYFSINPAATEEEYFIDDGAYLIISGILVIILMSLGGILTNLSHFGLGL